MDKTELIVSGLELDNLIDDYIEVLFKRNIIKEQECNAIFNSYKVHKYDILTCSALHSYITDLGKNDMDNLLYRYSEFYKQKDYSVKNFFDYIIIIFRRSDDFDNCDITSQNRLIRNIKKNLQ
mgnify:FL=1